MLPFVYIDERATAGLKPWGVLVVLGYFVWEAVVLRRAKRLGIDLREVRQATAWVALMSVLLGHWIEMVFYQPARLAAEPWSFLKIWEGQSSFGGFLGAAMGGYLWSRFSYDKARSRWPARRTAPVAALPMVDLFMSTFPIGFTIARVGCALVHDHPGILAPAGSPFALAWPLDPSDGVHRVLGPLHVVTGGSMSRYDLGLLELPFLLLMVVALVASYRRTLPDGVYTAAVFIAYGAARLGLDFLRARDLEGADPRYLELTFAQWASLAMIGAGVVLVRRAVASRRR
jgi:phosphatidylglycerol:prolipoprotein diacylglycerol transferase